MQHHKATGWPPLRCDQCGSRCFTQRDDPLSQFPRVDVATRLGEQHHEAGRVDGRRGTNLKAIARCHEQDAPCLGRREAPYSWQGRPGLCRQRVADAGETPLGGGLPSPFLRDASVVPADQQNSGQPQDIREHSGINQPQPCQDEQDAGAGTEGREPGAGDTDPEG